MTNYADYAEEIRKARQASSLTMSELARRVGTSRQYIWQLEHGERGFSLAMARKIAAACEISVGELLDGQGRG